MKFDLDTEFKVTLRDVALLSALLLILGALLWIFAPVVIFGLIVFAVSYVGFTAYDAIKKRNKTP